jgi:hypothetical protein
MRLFARFRSWLKWIVKRTLLEIAMEAEVRFHIESYAEDLVRSGVPEEQAMRRARIEFGGIESHKDAIRASIGLRWWDDLWGDLQYGVRILRKNPGFTAIAVVSPRPRGRRRNKESNQEFGPRATPWAERGPHLRAGRFGFASWFNTRLKTGRNTMPAQRDHIGLNDCARRAVPRSNFSPTANDELAVL